MKGQSMVRRTLWMAFFLGVVGAFGSAAQAFETKVTDAAVFKNGYAFMLRSGDCGVEHVMEEGSWASTKEIPQALLGTFWVYSLTDGVKVTAVKSGQEEITKKVKANTLDELLLASLGKKVQLRTSFWDTKGERIEAKTEGVLLFAEGRWAGEKPSVEEMAQPERGGYAAPPGEPMVVLQTEEGILTLQRSQLSSVLFPDTAPEQVKEFDTVTMESRMKVILEGQDKKPKIGLAYMTKGIRWLPAYQVSLLDDETARLRLQANIVNDVEDLEGATLHFVVGVPHFIMGDTLSPVSLQAAFQGLSSYFQIPSSREGAAMASQMMSNVGAYGGGYPGYPAAAPAPMLPAAPSGLVPGPLPSPFEESGQLATAGAEDLFLYKKEGIWLKKGEREMVDIFQAEVPYSHLYQWEITGDQIGAEPDQGRQRTPEEIAAELTKDKVWHCVKLENKTEMPWTTGPAMTMKDWKPLGQDMLNYTAVGDKATVKITIAPDIGAKKEELETDRQRQALNVYGNPYDLVTITGTLTLENFKKEKVAMEVSRMVTGEVSETTEGGKVTKGGTALRGLNPVSTVKWEFDLQPGEKKTLTYVFKAYIRSDYQGRY